MEKSGKYYVNWLQRETRNHLAFTVLGTDAGSFGLNIVLCVVFRRHSRRNTTHKQYFSDRPSKALEFVQGLNNRGSSTWLPVTAEEMRLQFDPAWHKTT